MRRRNDCVVNIIERFIKLITIISLWCMLMSEVPKEVEVAAKVLIKSKFAISLTGAGISVESGIPPFRGRGGVWSSVDPEEVATATALRRNPRRVWEWHKEFMRYVFNAKPNPAHIALAKLEELGIIKCVITQNIDELHQMAGSKCVIELHGNIRYVRCTRCDYRARIDRIPEEDIPKCPVCGAMLRPDIVLFEEPLPREALEKAFELAEKADAILVVGTSGVVMPAGYIPHVVKQHGGIVIEVNVEPSAITTIADIYIEMPASKALTLLHQKVVELLSKSKT